MQQKLTTRIQHKIDTYKNWEKATNFTPLKGEIIIYTTDENDEDKISLKIGNGQDNVNILPFVETAAAGGAGGGTATPQIQSDWLQENPSKKDYIKNKPFYSLPPEYEFKFRAQQKFNPITWNGDITNRKEILVSPVEVLEGVHFFKVAEQTIDFSDLENSTMHMVVPLGDMSEEEREMINYYHSSLKLAPEALNEVILYQDNDFLISQFMIFANTAGTLSLDVGLGVPLEIEFPEPGIYFMRDDSNPDEIYYVTELTSAYDILTDPNLWLVPNIFGEGTVLAYDKVSNDFIPYTMLLNSTFGLRMIEYDGFEGEHISQNLTELVYDSLIKSSLVILEDGISWFLGMNGVPLVSSINTPGLSIEGIEIQETGTYLGYFNTETGNLDGIECVLEHWNTPERITKIDPKYIPKNEINIKSDWDQSNPEKSDFIKNKPFTYNYIYNYDYDNVQNSQVKVPLGDSYPNSYFGLVRDIKFDNSGALELSSINLQTSNGTRWLNDTIIYRGWNYAQYNIYNSDYDAISGTTTLMIYVDYATNTDIYINGNYYYLDFPQRGMYYLYALEDLGFYLQRINYLYYFKTDSNYQADWSVDNSNHPGYIRNKPNMTTTDYIEQYSSSPVSSKAVYNAIGGSSISKTSSVTSGSSSLVTSGGVYSALQNVKVTADTSVSSTSTNPIQSKAIYTALGNRTSLPTISSTVSSGSSNIITSGGVYTALGNRTKLEFDTTPTSGSSKLLTSGNIYTALQNIEIDVDDVVTETSDNPVSSAAIYEAINNISISEADTIDGYHFRVSTETPLSKDVTEKTITFVI